MILLQTIALLCQVYGRFGSERYNYSNLPDTAKFQLSCQQSYLHCVNVKVASKVGKEEALEKCVVEKK